MPHLYPVASVQLSPRDRLSIALRASPVGDGLGMLPLSSYSVESVIDWTRGRWGVGLGASSLKAKKSSRMIENTMFTLMGTYRIQ